MRSSRPETRSFAKIELNWFETVRGDVRRCAAMIVGGRPSTKSLVTACSAHDRTFGKTRSTRARRQRVTSGMAGSCSTVVVSA